jgi:homoserine kinase type II
MDQIFDILRKYPPDCQPNAVEPLGSAGGMSGAQFWRLAAPRGILALRRWPTEHPTPERLLFIHAVLQHAADHEMTILPIPIATTAGPNFFQQGGHLWELTPWLPGTADYEKSPTVEKLRAAMTALAHFHNAVADFPPSTPLASSRAVAPAIKNRLDRLRALPSSGIEELSRAIDDNTWPDLAPLAHRFLAMLPHAIPGAIAELAPLAHETFRLQSCIRDIWHDHVLFDANRVTGLIDFGAMAIDTPATDIARLLGSLASSRHAPHAVAAPNIGAKSASDHNAIWTTGLVAYTTIRPLTDQEALAARALDTSGTILAGGNWIRWIYIEGRQFDDRSKIIQRFGQIVDRMTQSFSRDSDART